MTMSLSPSKSLLVVLATYALFLQCVTAADPLFHFCSTSSGNFTKSSLYEANLNKLAGDLSYKVPPTGFGQGSVGQYQDQTYGLGLCRGDVSSSDCMSCVAESVSEARKQCPNNKGAVIWYDNCMVKYSDQDFFGKIDYENRFYMWNLNNVSNPTVFNNKTRELLTELADEAYENPKMYKTGESDLDASTKIYGLVQCTRDITPSECKKCLDDAIGELPSCCDGKEGGRVVGGSCNFRYEIYPFVKA